VNKVDPGTVPPVIGRRLNESELSSYRHVPRDLATRARIVEIPALPGGYVGMTLGNLILLSEHVADDGSSSLLAHELVHVRQWSDEGRVRFLRRYLGDFAAEFVRTRSWSRSYRAIGHEVEARETAARWSRSHQAGRAT
jgi:hypothetical protein